MAASVVVILGLAGGAWWLTGSSDVPSGEQDAGADGAAVPKVFTVPSPAWLSRPILGVLDGDDPEESQLAEAMRDRLSQHFRLASSSLDLLAHRMETEASSEQLLHYPLAPVQDHYVEGRAYLDGPASQLNIRRAQASFETALRLDENHAAAQAGLCEALLEEYWMDDAEWALNDASLACGRAVQLAPWAPGTRVAQAHLLRATGRADEAVEVLVSLLMEDPNDVNALLGLVAGRLARYDGSGDVDELALALDAARHARAVDPGFWQPPFWQASLAYILGDLAGAIEAGEEARRRDENESVLVNLGTFYLCAAELDRAREACERARELVPHADASHAYVSDELLATIHYLTGEFDTAAELRARAIERLRGAGDPETHDMWGNLGDAYFESGRPKAAIEAYLRAVEITERDVLQGIDSPADRASRAYYYSRLALLAPERLPPGAGARIERDLRVALDEPLEAGAAVRVAKAWLQYERPGLALRAFEQAVALCAGYASTPALASLRPMLGTGELSASP